MLAQTDRQAYLAMTPEQQVAEAARLAADEVVADAVKKKQRVALTIRKARSRYFLILIPRKQNKVLMLLNL